MVGAVGLAFLTKTPVVTIVSVRLCVIESEEELGEMKLNETERQKMLRWKSWQKVKNAKLYSV